MDMTILVVAAPELARDVRPSSVELLWIMDVYSLVVAGLLVTAAAIGDRFGRRKTLIGGYAVFGLASLLILVAESGVAIIAIRGLLGVGGAMIMPSTLSMIRTLFTDERERAKALGIWSAVAGAGAATGPIVGGVLLEAFSWHAAFLLNVPLMGIGIVGALVFLPESRSSGPGRIDAFGVLLSVGGAASLMFAVKHLGNAGLDAQSVGFAALGTVLLTVFTRRCLRLPEPMLEIGLLADERVRAGALTALLIMIGSTGLLFVAAQWLQLVGGVSPLGTGLVMLPLAAVSVIVSLLMPGLVERFGRRACLVGALLIGGIGLAVPILVVDEVTVAALIVALGLAGISLGALSIVSTLIISGTPAEKSGSAAAIQETSFEFGAALSVTVIGTLATAVFRAALPGGVGDVTREPAEALTAGVAGAAAAYTDALLWVVIASSAVLLLTGLIVGLLLRRRQETALAPAPIAPG